MAIWNRAVFKFKVCLFLFTLNFPYQSPCKGDILVRDSIAQVPALIQEGDLVLCDVDNTLMAPIQFFGNDYWNDGIQSLILQVLPSNPPQPKNEHVIDVLYRLMEASVYRAMEAGTLEALKTIHKIKNVKTMGLTARRFSYARRFQTEWDRSGLTPENFTMATALAPLTNQPTDTDPLPYVFKNQTFPFFKGVLYTNAGPKLPVWKRFVKEVIQPRGITYKRIVFIDDKRKHLELMATGLKESGTPFLGINYTFAHKYKSPQYQLLGFIQGEYYVKTGQLMTDNEGFKQLAAMKNKPEKEKNSLLLHAIQSTFQLALGKPISNNQATAILNTLKPF